MIDLPQVSIVIPLFNRGSTIARTLNSLFAQTFQDFEVVVVDGASTDEGPRIVKSYGDRVIFIEQAGKGVSQARNQGIEAARAELIAFIDADDEWSPEHLTIIIELFHKFPEAGLYGTAFEVEQEDLVIRPIVVSEIIPREPWEGLMPRYFLAAALGDPPFFTSTVAIRKQVLSEMNGFSTEAWWGEDTDLWGRIALKYPIAYSWRGKGTYHSDATNRLVEKIKATEENIFVTRGLEELKAGHVPSHMVDDLKEYLALKMIHSAERNLAAGRPDLARSNLWRCQTRYLQQRKIFNFIMTLIPSQIYLTIMRLAMTGNKVGHR